MLYPQAILISTACLLALRCLPHVAEWIRAWVILQRMPGPPGGLMGHLKYFNTLAIGHHKTVCQWAREYGGIFRVRLANVNVGPCSQQALDDALHLARPFCQSHACPVSRFDAPHFRHGRVA